MKSIILSILEDDPAHILVIKSVLKTLFKDIKFSLAKDGEELLYMLPDNMPDLLLLDKNTPKINGFEVIEFVRGNQLYNYLPIAVFSSSDKESDKVKAFSLGADAYHVKPSQDQYGEVLIQVFTDPYPKRKNFIKPSSLPLLLEKTEQVKKDSSWGNIDAMMEDL